MKKLFILLISVFALSTLHADYYYYEEYTGSQKVNEGQDYNFGFDMWYENTGVGTDSSLALTKDEEGAFGEYVEGSLYIDFYDKGCFEFLQAEEAQVTLTAWNGNGDDAASVTLDTINFNVGTFLWWGSDTYSYEHQLTAAQLDAFDDWGWGNVNIMATLTNCWNYNDFYIKKVGMGVATPEPSSIALLIFGLFGLAAKRRKR